MHQPLSQHQHLPQPVPSLPANTAPCPPCHAKHFRFTESLLQVLSARDPALENKVHVAVTSNKLVIEHLLKRGHALASVSLTSKTKRPLPRLPLPTKREHKMPPKAKPPASDTPAGKCALTGHMVVVRGQRVSTVCLKYSRHPHVHPSGGRVLAVTTMQRTLLVDHRHSQTADTAETRCTASRLSICAV